MKSFKDYKIDLAGLTVDEGFDMLFDYGLEDMTIQVQVGQHNLEFTTIWDFCKQYSSNTLASHAGPFIFYGGPKQTIETWGTLFTLCLDQLMYHESTKKRNLVGV